MRLDEFGDMMFREGMKAAGEISCMRLVGAFVFGLGLGFAIARLLLT